MDIEANLTVLTKLAYLYFGIFFIPIILPALYIFIRQWIINSRRTAPNFPNRLAATLGLILGATLACAIVGDIVRFIFERDILIVGIFAILGLLIAGVLSAIWWR